MASLTIVVLNTAIFLFSNEKEPPFLYILRRSILLLLNGSLEIQLIIHMSIIPSASAMEVLNPLLGTCVVMILYSCKRWEPAQRCIAVVILLQTLYLILVMTRRLVKFVLAKIRTRCCPRKEVKLET